jgi:hypothetical protein
MMMVKGGTTTLSEPSLFFVDPSPTPLFLPVVVSKLLLRGRFWRATAATADEPIVLLLREVNYCYYCRFLFLMNISFTSWN